MRKLGNQWWHVKIRQRVVEGYKVEFSVTNDLLRFLGQICIPYANSLRNKILTNAYNFVYTAYFRSVKMYQD